MSQHFHIWRDQQTIQGLWPNCTWKDKQNQEKGLVLEPKTRKPKCILHKNSSLDFIQTYTSRHVAYLCIFLYMMSLSSEFHRSMHSPDIHHHLQQLICLNRFFHVGKNRNRSNRSNRFIAIYCDLLRFIAIFFSEIKLDTGKRLKRTIKIYSLHGFPFRYSREFKIDRVESYRMTHH